MRKLFLALLLLISSDLWAFKIRQEISAYYENTAADTPGYYHLDTTVFDGSPTYIWEVSEEDTVSTNTITLRRKGTSTDDATIVLAGVAETVQRVSFTPPAGATDYIIHNSAGGSGEDIQSRIIVSQTGLTKTQTQFDLASQLGSSSSISSTTLTNIGGGEYWKYTASHYNGSPTFKWVIEFLVSIGSETGTAELQTSSNGGGSWSAVGSDVTTSSTTVVRFATTFTATDGNLYRILAKISNGAQSTTVYVSYIEITQASSPTKFELEYSIHSSTQGMGRLGATNFNPADWSGVTNTYSHVVNENVGSAGSGDVIASRSPEGAGGSTLTGSSITSGTPGVTLQYVAGPVTMPGSSTTVDYNYSVSTNSSFVDDRILVVSVASASTCLNGLAMMGVGC